MRQVASWLAPVLLVALGACATPFKADVSRFQAMPPAQGQSFTIKPADPGNAGGIEFGQYAALVSAQMQRQGYVPAPAGAPADLTVTLGYGVDQGKERTVVYDDPFYDPFWGYGRYGFGGGYYRPYILRTPRGARYVYGWYDPFLYGPGWGRGIDVRSYTVYTSGIDMKIERSSSGERLFEGKAEAKSRSNRLPYLVPNLVTAMFTGFPGNSGETVRISVAPEEKRR